MYVGGRAKPIQIVGAVSIRCCLSTVGVIHSNAWETSIVLGGIQARCWHQKLWGHGELGIRSGIRQFNVRAEFVPISVFNQALMGFSMPLVCLILMTDPV